MSPVRSDQRVEPDEVEVLLAGGLTNAGLVARRGDTVRRPRRPTSRATNALLSHLEGVGFAGAPRYRRVDSQGREVFDYIEGQAATLPLPDWSMTDDALVAVAQLLRGYHDAASGFDWARHGWPRPAPDRYGHTLVSHNDPCPDNVVFRDGRPVALIDFDLASPGSRLWDVACAARLWAPLRDPADVIDARAGHTLRRMRLFVDAYGLARPERARLPEAFVDAHDWCYRVVRAAVSGGHPSFGPYWGGGGAARADRSRAWLVDHQGALAAALG